MAGVTYLCRFSGNEDAKARVAASSPQDLGMVLSVHRLCGRFRHPQAALEAATHLPGFFHRHGVTRHFFVRSRKIERSSRPYVVKLLRVVRRMARATVIAVPEKIEIMIAIW